MRSTKTLKAVSLELIDEPGDVVRMDINPEEVTELAHSIAEIGLLQPILLRTHQDRYEIVAGHRRYLAHKELHLDRIKAFVCDMSDQETAFCRATENLARVDLTPIEEAAIFADLVKLHSMSYESIGKKVGKSPALVKRRIDLLKMPPQLQKAVHNKSISISVAEELWTISDMTDLDYYLMFALEGGCTKEVARTWAKDWRDRKRRSNNPSVGGASPMEPPESRPVYVACDLCKSPMELGQETVLRICPDCTKIVIKIK